MRLISLLSAAAIAFSSAAAADTVAPSQDASGVIPIPRMKPPLTATHTTKNWPQGRSGWPAEAVAKNQSLCESLLSGKDVTWSPLAPIGQSGGCGAAAPIEVSAIAGVSLEPSATITCALAVSLHSWITEAVQPAALRDLHTRITTIHTASSYACRRRNNQASGKLSEHGRANALDMAGFSFAKTKDVTVEDGWGGLLRKLGLSKSGGFLSDIRKDGCRYFTTVLGPGADPYHGDHFHVDVLERKNGYRICH